MIEAKITFELVVNMFSLRQYSAFWTGFENWAFVWNFKAWNQKVTKCPPFNPLSARAFF